MKGLTNRSSKSIISTFFRDHTPEEIVSIQKNPHSTDGNVYNISTNQHQYIAKIYSDHHAAAAMIAVHNNLTSRHINVPKIIHSSNLENPDPVLVIYSFIQGLPIDDTLKNGKVTKNLLPKIAKTLREIHDSLQGKNICKLPTLKIDTYKKRQTLLHFDLTKENIFLDQNHNIAIIDFDDAKYGSAVYDLAILISTFFFSKSRGTDLEGMQTFLSAYYAENLKLEQTESKQIQNCAIQWIDMLINDHKIDDSLIDSFMTKRKLINECSYFT